MFVGATVRIYSFAWMQKGIDDLKIKYTSGCLGMCLRYTGGLSTSYRIIFIFVSTANKLYNLFKIPKSSTIWKIIR